MQLIPKSVTNHLSRQALEVSKNSPTLLFGVGVVGVTVSTVLACRATLKLEEVLAEGKSDMETAAKIVADGDPRIDYTEEDQQRDTTIIYIRSALKVVKLYAPAVVIGTASIGALTASHRIQAQRNAALTAAFVALNESFNSYRAKVIEKYGEEEDRKLVYEYEEVEYVDAKGKFKRQQQICGAGNSIYARFFDSENANWNPDPETSLFFLRCVQNYMNDRLKARGHVFLNEVYDQIGLEHTSAGAVVGWVYGHGDNYVDLGVFGPDSNAFDYVNGRDGSLLLDFNVDGVIYDLIEA